MALHMAARTAEAAARQCVLRRMWHTRAGLSARGVRWLRQLPQSVRQPTRCSAWEQGQPPRPMRRVLPRDAAAGRHITLGMPRHAQPAAGPRDGCTRPADMASVCTRDGGTAERQHGVSAHATLLEAAGARAPMEATADDYTASFVDHQKKLDHKRECLSPTRKRKEVT